jgi:hypothetical protein
VAYLIGEILAFLLAATLIGAGMAWLLRGLRSHVRERRLSAELEEMRAGRDAAEAAVRTLETSLSELRAEMERETSRLKARLSEFEALLKTQASREPAQARLKNAASGVWRFLLRMVSGFSRLFS